MSAPVCKHWINGTCHFGDRCRYRHAQIMCSRYNYGCPNEAQNCSLRCEKCNYHAIDGTKFCHQHTCHTRGCSVGISEGRYCSRHVCGHRDVDDIGRGHREILSWQTCLEPRRGELPCVLHTCCEDGCTARIVERAFETSWGRCEEHLKEDVAVFGENLRTLTFVRAKRSD